jgi:hypothetical protein
MNDILLTDLRTETNESTLLCTVRAVSKIGDKKRMHYPTKILNTLSICWTSIVTEIIRSTGVGQLLNDLPTNRNRTIRGAKPVSIFRPPLAKFEQRWLIYRQRQAKCSATFRILER